MPMPSFGKGYSGYYLLRWKDGRIATHQPYRITRPDGRVIEGTTNEKGETLLRLAEYSESLNIELL